MNRFSCFYFSNCYFFYFFFAFAGLSFTPVRTAFFVFVLLSFDFVWMPKNSHLLWLFGTTAFEYELPTRCKCTYINNWICIQLESKRNYVKRQKIMYKQKKKLDREKKKTETQIARTSDVAYWLNIASIYVWICAQKLRWNCQRDVNFVLCAISILFI